MLQMNAVSLPPAPLDDAAGQQPLFSWITRDEVFRIETPRMWVRWMTAADAACLQAIGAHKGVAEMTATWPHPLLAGEAGRRIAASRALNAKGNALILGLTLKGHPNCVIGSIGCNALPTEHLGIGYMLDPALAGRGLASEALGGFVRALFTYTKIARIGASSRIINPASRRVLEKNGFVHEHSGVLETKARGPLEVDFLMLTRAIWKANLVRSRRHLRVINQTMPGGRDISAGLGDKIVT
jgi:RimJ/RimL family protein N-acetyltransferase